MKIYLAGLTANDQEGEAQGRKVLLVSFIEIRENHFKAGDIYNKIIRRMDHASEKKRNR